MRALRPSNLNEIDEAVERMLQMVRAEALPWMKDHADLDALVAGLRIPHASPGMEPERLEKLAVAHHLRGDDEEARAVLDTLHAEYMPTGIPAIDGPQERFWSSLRERLGER